MGRRTRNLARRLVAFRPFRRGRLALELGLLLRRVLLMRRRPGRWRHRASSLQLMLLLGKGWRLLVDWGV